MPPIEIDSTEYNSLKRAAADLVIANEQVTKLTETAENTKIALKTHRETEAELKKQVTTLEWEKETKTKEIEEKYKDFDTLKDNAEKWAAYNKKTTEDRTTNIDAMKTKLWDKFNDDVKDMIDGLDDVKIEKYLTTLLPKEEKKSPSLKSWEDKDKKSPDAVNERLQSLTDKKTAWLLSPTEKLEFLSLSSAKTDSGEETE